MAASLETHPAHSSQVSECWSGRVLKRTHMRGERGSIPREFAFAQAKDRTDSEEFESSKVVEELGKGLRLRCGTFVHDGEGTQVYFGKSAYVLRFEH